MIKARDRFHPTQIPVPFFKHASYPGYHEHVKCKSSLTIPKTNVPDYNWLLDKTEKTPVTKTAFKPFSPNLKGSTYEWPRSGNLVLPGGSSRRSAKRPLVEFVMLFHNFLSEASGSGLWLSLALDKAKPNYSPLKLTNFRKILNITCNSPY